MCVLPIFLLFLLPTFLYGQPACVKSNELLSLQVLASNCAHHTPVIPLCGDDFVTIDFDMLGHEYRRLTYHVEHCSADWTTASDLMKSEYLEGFDGLTIDDYEESTGTAVIYTHYNVQLPNENLNLRLSGNYRLWIVDEESGDSLAAAAFMVVDAQTAINASVSGRTDLDINRSHQQLELGVNFQRLSVADVDKELTVVVQQGRRWDTHTVLPPANLRTVGKIGWSHQRSLIFEAGNACHKFEMLGKRNFGQGIDHIEYHSPYEHVVLQPIEPATSYNYDEDLGGAFVLRNLRNDNDTEGEYRWVHFAFDSERLPSSEHIYVVGDLTQGRLLSQFELVWNDNLHLYECAALLKEGYYEYRLVHTSDTAQRASQKLTDGNFYETRNEYEIMVYHRGRGERYDRLVGYARCTNN